MFEELLSWLQSNPEYAALAVFVNAMLEAVVGIGLFVPGAVLLGLSTFLYSQEIMTLGQIMPFAFAGAFLADQSGFWLGRKLGPGFHATEFANKYQASIRKTENMIQRYGWGAILLGRFMTAIRSIVPLITGMSGFSPVKYVVIDFIVVAGWCAGLWALTLGTDKLLGV